MDYAKDEEYRSQHIFEVNDTGEVLDNLRMTLHCLVDMESSWKWKWVILCMYQSIYSLSLSVQAGTFAIANVTRKDNRHKAYALDRIGYSQEQIAKELDEELSKVEKWFREYDPFVLGYEQIIGQLQYCPTPGTRPLRQNHSMKCALDWLQFHRNKLVHRMPRVSWDIEIDLIVSNLLNVLPVLRQLAEEANRSLLVPDEQAQLTAIIDAIESALLLKQQLLSEDNASTT